MFCHSFCRALLLFQFFFAFSGGSKQMNPLGDTGRLKSAGVLKQLLKEEGIIPELLDEAPRHGVTVRYKDRSLAFGNKLQVHDIVEEPFTVNWPLKKGELYTLIMTGLDMPSRDDPNEREYLHWLVVNIPDRNIREGLHILPYAGATFEYQTGVHRVVFLIYQQDGIITEPNKAEYQTNFRKVVRKQFSTQNFTASYRLGPPLAINFGEIDDACDIHSPPEL